MVKGGVDTKVPGFCKVGRVRTPLRKRFIFIIALAFLSFHAGAVPAWVPGKSVKEFHGDFGALRTQVKDEKADPLDHPGAMTKAALMSWVALVSSEAMSFGYNDHQRRMDQSMRHFTRQGWETFSTAVLALRIMDDVVGNKETVTATPHSAPIILQEDVMRGKYRWIVKLPLQLSFDGNAETARKAKLNVTLVIARVPYLESPAGVAIEQWVSTQSE